ncbi:sulfite exporter TauE/SafE family protein [Thermodesulfovibrio sp.]|uniref:sulfite exporter TauE/SafE family protein n=1 Tax=Thermodesulfovibrio sp. TaxID=2067987 RepID=UPI0030AB7B07
MKSQVIHSLWIGLLAGCFGGLVGLGGGVVMIPLMVAVLKITQHKAHGTSLFALVFTGITGAVTYGMKGSVDVIASVILAITAIFTARAGAKFAHSLPEWKLKRAFGGFLIFAALILLLKPYLASLYHFEFEGYLKIITLLIVGIFAGFLAGMMGIGGGTVMVPALVLILNYGQHIAQGTSLLCMVPAGAVGAYTHLKLGNVIKGLLPGLIIGIIAGTYIGSTIAHFLSEGNLRVIFAIIIIWTGIRFLKTPKPVK